MKSSHRKRKEGQPVIGLIEGSVVLLRRQPVENLFLYYLGALPFALGLVFFWADMSAGALAHEHLAGGAFGIALLWIWMKCWQAVYGERLKSWIMQVPPAPLSIKRLMRIGLVEAATSPWGFVLLPASMILTIPLVWCIAFFQNITMLDRGDGTPLREHVRSAWHQARLWPRQNHLLLLIISLITFIVCINILSLLMILPHLLKTLLGIESLFGMNSFSMLNSTLWVIVGILTYLIIDPLVKAIYVQRCYQGRSLHTGEDLLADLHISLSAKKTFLVALFVCGMLITGFFAATTARAEAESLPHRTSHSSEQMNKAIEEEISRIEYSWRMPREPEPEEDKEESGFMRVAIETVKYWVDALGGGIKDFFGWLGELIGKMFPKVGLGKPVRQETSAGTGFVLLYLLLGIVVCIAALIAWRHLHKKKDLTTDIEGGVRLGEIDLESEQVKASDLPTDQWLALAEDLLGKGERRLALRAFYLGGLAGLAGAELLTLARFKSDSDYRRELIRAGLAGQQTVEAFSQNILIFQQAWYGMRDVNEELLNRFRQNHQRIMAHVR